MAEERQIVIPGEVIVSGNEFLPGEGAYRDGKDVVAGKYGLANLSEKHVRVIPVSGAYYPRRGNTIIGTIVDITFNGWLIDFGGAQNAFLPVAEVPRYINRNELREFLDFGESVVVKVWDVKSRGIDVSMKMRGFNKIEGGMIISVSPNKVPRIIGKEGSMVKMIKGATGCDITVGQNGKVWISGDSTEKELSTRKIVEFVVDNATISGLTEKVEGFIKDMGLDSGVVEIVAENTDKEDGETVEEQGGKRIMAGIYTKRDDGREMTEVRPMKAKVGIVPSADGSASFETGKTKAIAVVRGPRTLHPQHMQNPKTGILRVNYGMMPFSVEDRIRPGPNRRSEEISKVTEWALSSVVDLSEFPNTVVDVFIQIPQADAGTRVAGINAAAMALAHAGIPMKEMVSAIGVGKIDKTLVVDLDKFEDSEFHDAEGSTDIPVVLTSRSKEIALLQLDGKISIPEFKEVVEMAKVACEDILKVQMEALKNVNGEDKDNE